LPIRFALLSYDIIKALPRLKGHKLIRAVAFANATAFFVTIKLTKIRRCTYTWYHVLTFSLAISTTVIAFLNDMKIKKLEKRIEELERNK